MSNDTSPETTHDETLLDLFRDLAHATLAVMAAGRSVTEYASAAEGSGIRYDRKGYVKDGCRVTVDEARPWVEALRDGTVPVAGSRYLGWERRAGHVLTGHDEAVATYRAATLAIAAHEESYTGWSRFYLVTSSAGHVHSSMDCTTCYDTTTYGLLPSLSGKDEAAAVALLGQSLCTVCFPSAPANPSKFTQAQAAKLVEEGEAAFLADQAKRNAATKAECPGSGTFHYDRATARIGFYSGNAGTCEDCGGRITLTSGNKLRKHQAA